jgi:hypothetical protein
MNSLLLHVQNRLVQNVTQIVETVQILHRLHGPRLSWMAFTEIHVHKQILQLKLEDLIVAHVGQRIAN